MFDVTVIGGGVIGGLILRELTRYKLSVCLVERAHDVSMGASKANSGIVHAGYDAMPGTLKAKFNVLGNRMMPEVCRELGVKYRNNGSLVVAFTEQDVDTLHALKQRGEQNGVEGLEIIDYTRLKELERNISPRAVAALHAPTGGIVCPYELTIAAIGNAMDNGATLMTGFDVNAITGSEGNFTITARDGLSFGTRVIINCAGIGSGEVARLVGDEYFSIGARRGEYVLLDRESGDFVSHTLFFTPTKAGKGILVTPTVDGNILLGPTAEEIPGEDRSTTAKGIGFVLEKASIMCEKAPFYNTITSFAGVRAYSDRHDFIIEHSPNTRGVIHCAGIESPGLTAAPAIAGYVAKELVSALIPLEDNPAFDGRRAPDYFFKNLSVEEKNELIKKDPSYGKIVCRCEQITEGEILRAIRENPPARDVDGVKRRTRAGMGRCQGGFCQPYVAELIAGEQGVSLDKVRKNGPGSELLVGVTK